MTTSEVYANLGWHREGGGVEIAGIADIARDRRDRKGKNHTTEIAGIAKNW